MGFEWWTLSCRVGMAVKTAWAEKVFFLNIFKHLILKIILLASPCVFNVLTVMKKSQMKTPEQTVSETPHLDLSFPPWLCTALRNAEI